MCSYIASLAVIVQPYVLIVIVIEVKYRVSVSELSSLDVNHEVQAISRPLSINNIPHNKVSLAYTTTDSNSVVAI